MASDSSPGWQADGRAVRLIRHDPASPVDVSRWPATVPAVGQMLCEGLELAPGLTVLVGENGSGKSTLVELLAEASELNPQGGSAQARLFRTRPSEPDLLGTRLIIERGAARPRWSYFLRTDTMHSLYSYLEDTGLAGFHELSHGEGFLEILRTRVNQPGFYLMDEPDAPLSFTACLGLVALLHASRGPGPRPSSPPIRPSSPPSRREHPGTGRLGHPYRPVGEPRPGQRLAPVPDRARLLLPPPAHRITQRAPAPQPSRLARRPFTDMDCR